MYARVYIERLTVNQHTPDDDRDEVYFVVSGRSQAGDFFKPRIPEPPHTYEGNDYYGLHDGEAATDTHEQVNPMTLWQGWIDYNQAVGLSTVVREQDGAPISEIVLSIPRLVGPILTGDIGSLINEIGQLAGSIVRVVSEDHHDTVGAFTLVMKNEGNQPTFKWDAVPGITTLQSVGNDAVARFSCTGSGANYTVDPAVQQWMQIDVKHSGMTLDVRGNSLSPSTPIQQFPWNGGNNQLWEITRVEGQYVRIERAAVDTSRHSGLCLDVANASLVDGAPVVQFPWHGGYNQQWRIEPVSNGWNRIVNRNSGKCLDVRGGSAESQAIVQQFNCQSGDNQLWRIW